jgi:conjugal transfer/entry exclusion protein
VAEVSTEASELREKVYSLEKSVENYRGKARDAESKVKETARDLEEKLQSATKSKKGIEEALKKVNGEKAEVIAALEGVINEVQNREDEIESLSDLLQRRDEELQHAKIIATKALQSAKDIQKRFKDKDRQSDLLVRMDELTDNVDELASRNETLQRKISMLERELRDRNLECKRLKDQLRQIDGKQLRGNDSSRVNEDTFSSRGSIKDNGSAISMQSTYASTRSFPNPASSGSLSGRALSVDTDSVDPDGLAMEADSFSPSTSPRSPGSFGGVEFPAFEKQPSDEHSDDAGSSTIVSEGGGRWGQDFDADNRSDFGSVASDNRSRRSIERDALRKYVRQRYMKRSDN